MLRGLTATVVATCFCLSPAPLSEQVPVAPDAIATIRDAVTADAIPEHCLTAARAWSHLSRTCPRMPALEDPFIRVGARPLILSRVR